LKELEKIRRVASMAQRTVNRRQTTTYRANVQGNVARQLQAVPNRPERVNGPVEVPRRKRKPERKSVVGGIKTPYNDL
jgi:hypothetical protein